MKAQARSVVALGAALAALAVLLVAPALGAVGVEKVSRHAAKPGARVTVTLGCGFCFPPCKGAPGHRNGPCMLGTKEDPPASFPISLVPLEQAPLPRSCGPNSVCPPEAKAPPARAPYALLGEALAEGRKPGGAPRYGLDFEVPDLRPGLYAYVVYCDVCNRGAGGSLIAVPQSRLWRLRVR
ncbi:MAG: hypothetical protein ACOYD4_15255 [Solirubrobacterales bacterium]